jgi:Domain of unknown function (DUF4864)
MTDSLEDFEGDARATLPVEPHRGSTDAGRAVTSSRPRSVVGFFVEENMRVHALIFRVLPAPLAFACATFFSVATFAFSESDRAESRAVIERQIDAFRRDDGAGAFAFASPELQTLFQNPERFMSMVRNGYQPVYRPKAYSFSGVTESEAGLIETLAIEDAEGQAWTAVYTLEKQPDGSWKITSCHLLKTGVST